jgi:2-keto-3-deoxy-L-rhamnonate aldolase RhmA
VVPAANFQPQGRRSSTSGPHHFLFRSYSAEVSNLVVNASTLVIPMIETFEALELVDEIAAHDRVDSLLIGTNDLTAEMGIPAATRDLESLRLISAPSTPARRFASGFFRGLHLRLNLVEKFCAMGADWLVAANNGRYCSELLLRELARWLS